VTQHYTYLGMHQHATPLGIGIMEQRGGDAIERFAAKHGSSPLIHQHHFA
jgi:hypothetical protein